MRTTGISQSVTAPKETICGRWKSSRICPSIIPKFAHLDFITAQWPGHMRSCLFFPLMIYPSREIFVGITLKRKINICCNGEGAYEKKGDWVSDNLCYV